MSIKRFAAPADLNTGDDWTPGPSEYKHFSARRVKEGERVHLIAGSRRWLAEVTSTDPLTLRVISPADAPPPLPLSIAVAVPSANRASVMVEKCCEFGLSRFLPMTCERSVVKPKNPSKLVARWSRVAMAAAKQSGAQVTRIARPVEYEQLLQNVSHPVLLHPGGDTSLVEHFAANSDIEHTIFIGPEGGFTPAETEQALETGANLCTLARTVLRVETAAIAACAILAGLSSGSH